MKGIKKRNDRMNLKFQYSCVNAPDVQELNYITDNSQVISYRTFRKHVNSESFNEIKDFLGYNRQLYKDCGITFKNDWSITFHKSKTPSGKKVYYFCHSGIEYIFY